MTGVGHADRRGGFALAMVVFLLFAVAVAGATGFQVVSTEFTLATQNRDSQEALIVARAGLQRFLGETVGVVGDSVSYAIGNGVATVTTRKLYEKDTRNHLYYIRSVGSVADARTPANPATRKVGAYAWHRIAPVPQNGALWVSGGTVTLSNRARIYGDDGDPSGSCEGATTKAGVVRGGNISPSSPTTYVPTGSPTVVSYPGYSAVYDTVGIRWDILTSPNFPVDFDGYSPGYIAADSFPIVRYSGNLDATWAWSGRGVLIVTGRLRFSSFFRWEGIILAGSMAQPTGWTFWSPADAYVEGMVIAGMNSANPSFTLNLGQVQYHSCDAYLASKSLSYLELVENTLFEVNG